MPRDSINLAAWYVPYLWSRSVPLVDDGLGTFNENFLLTDLDDGTVTDFDTNRTLTRSG